MLKYSILFLFTIFFLNVNGQPDLIVNQDLVVSPNSLHIGEIISVSFRVRNIGTSNAGASHLGIYLSNSNLGLNSQLLSEISLEPLVAGGLTETINFVYPIPHNANGGINYIIVRVNDLNEIPAVSLCNNEFISDLSDFFIK